MALLPTLALDLATRTGWARGVKNAPPVLGTLDFAGREHPRRFRALEEWLDETADKAGGLGEVVHYAKGGFAGQLAMKLHWGFAITCEMWCWDNRVAYRTEHEGTVRKLLLGRGTFRKDEAKPAVRRWAEGRNLQGTQDAYDSALLLHYALMVPRP